MVRRRPAKIAANDDGSQRTRELLSPVGAMRTQLAAVRHRLLELHKGLLDGERERYEQVHGKVTPGKMLQLAFQDPQFAWLRSMSELIVRIDESLETEETTDADLETLLSSVRTLLSPVGQSTNFAREYEAALQRDPHVVVLHGRVTEVLDASRTRSSGHP